MGSAAAGILAGLEPVLEAFPDSDGILTALVGALMGPAQAVDDVATDTDTHDAWQVIYDPDACPAAWLPWLAQHVGVRLPPFATETQQRRLIGQSAEWYAGTVRALLHDVAMTLTTRTGAPPNITFQRHVGGNRWLEIVTINLQELIAFDLPSTQAAVQRNKPAGVTRQLLTSDAPLIDQGTRLINNATATIQAATLDDIT